MDHPSHSRRAFLQRAAASAAAALATPSLFASPPASSTDSLPNTSTLRDEARRSGKVLGCYSGMHALLMEPETSAILADTFSLIAVGNDLKFSDRLHPTPNTYNFEAGDADVAWAEQHHKLFRGHCLVWWNALPSWFSSYVNAENARQVMTEHITRVVGHYAGRIYSWDVANEMIYHDNRSDGLRRKPWLEFVGPDFLDLAFHTAHQADPKARLVLNECYIEHATDAEKTRRAQLLALALRLKKSNVPITHVGVQGHLRGAVPLDGPGLTDFCKQLHDAGLEVMITELDVDTVNVLPSQHEQVAAAKYGEFLDIMGPWVKVITFEALYDAPDFPKNQDGTFLTANLLNAKYQTGAVYNAVVASLNHLQRT